MRITTTNTETIHLINGEKERLIYIECKDVYLSLKDKTSIFYIEKGYIEDFEDTIQNITVQKDYKISRNILKYSMTIADGELLEVIELKLKEIVLQKIANNEDFLSGMTSYNFE